MTWRLARWWPWRSRGRPPIVTILLPCRCPHAAFLREALHCWRVAAALAGFDIRQGWRQRYSDP